MDIWRRGGWLFPLLATNTQRWEGCLAILHNDNSAVLVDSQDALRLPYPGSIILAPNEDATVELSGSAQPVPLFTIEFTYSDATGQGLSRTQIPYNRASDEEGQQKVSLVALAPTFTPHADGGTPVAR